MADFAITDALTGDIIEFDYATGNVEIDRLAGVQEMGQATSIFFPGCSFMNYATPLMASVYDFLKQAGEVNGMSVLCCGKILSYEPNGQELRDAFEDELRDHLAQSSIERMVCVCPNCVKALREALSLDPRAKDIQIVVLPQLLAEMSYQLDPKVCARLIKGDEEAEVLLCPHDSCPDREYGQFADGLRALMPEGFWQDPAHARKRSVCCGSLPRAAGKFEQADKCAMLNATEAQDLGADAIVTPCMSCTFQLNMTQPLVQCVHYLELLFDWRVDWSQVGTWMKLRFLFNDTLGATEKVSETRSFAGIGGACDAVENGTGTEADAETCEREAEGSITQMDEAAASEVTISNANVVTLSEEDDD